MGTAPLPRKVSFFASANIKFYLDFLDFPAAIAICQLPIAGLAARGVKRRIGVACGAVSPELVR
jgi:hypothetical protein